MILLLTSGTAVCVSNKDQCACHANSLHSGSGVWSLAMTLLLYGKFMTEAMWPTSWWYGIQVCVPISNAITFSFENTFSLLIIRV